MPTPSPPKCLNLQQVGVRWRVGLCDGDVIGGKRQIDARSKGSLGILHRDERPHKLGWLSINHLLQETPLEVLNDFQLSSFAAYGIIEGTISASAGRNLWMYMLLEGIDPSYERMMLLLAPRSLLHLTLLRRTGPKAESSLSISCPIGGRTRHQ